MIAISHHTTLRIQFPRSFYLLSIPETLKLHQDASKFVSVQFNLMYLAGVALICVGNLAFYWRPVLSLEDLSSLIGSSGSSGDTEVSSDTGSCNAVQLDMTPASALVPGSPPYHLQVRGQTRSYTGSFCHLKIFLYQQIISLSSCLEETD